MFAAAFALMVLDFADRQVVVATLPALQAEWGLSDTQRGALVSVVSVAVGLGAFPAALLADRWSRVRGIALMGSRRLKGAAHRRRFQRNEVIFHAGDAANSLHLIIPVASAYRS